MHPQIGIIKFLSLECVIRGSGLSGTSDRLIGKRGASKCIEIFKEIWVCLVHILYNIWIIYHRLMSSEEQTKRFVKKKSEKCCEWDL